MAAKKKKLPHPVDPEDMTVAEVQAGAPMRSAGELAQEEAASTPPTAPQIHAEVLSCLKMCQEALSELKSANGLNTVRRWEFDRTRAGRANPKVASRALELLEVLIGPPVDQARKRLTQVQAKSGVRFIPNKKP